MSVRVDPVSQHPPEFLPARIGVTVRCGCGWVCDCYTVRATTARWRNHVRLERHTDQLARTVMRYDQSRRRCEELAALTTAAQRRREALRHRRGELRAEMTRRRTALLTAEHRASTALLDAARIVAGLTIVDLWIDYFGLGGDVPMVEFVGALSGERPLLRRDHDRIAIALNERFSDLGWGRPVSLWDGTH
jgi:hypothetical protein